MAHLGDEISHGDLEESKCYCFSYLQIRVDNFNYPPLDPPIGLNPHPGDKYKCTLIPGAVAGATCWRIRVRQNIGCMKGMHIPAVQNGLEEVGPSVINTYEDCPKSYLKYASKGSREPNPDLIVYWGKTYTQLDICGECEEPPTGSRVTGCDDTYFPTDLFLPRHDDWPPLVGWSFDSMHPDPGSLGGPMLECIPPRIPSDETPWTGTARFTPPGRPGSARMVSTSPDPIYFNTAADVQEEEDEIKRMLAWAEHEDFLTKPKEICEVLRNWGKWGRPPVFGICNIHNQKHPTDRKNYPGGGWG